MGTLAITVNANGSARQYVIVKAYGVDGFAAKGETNGSGQVSLTVPAGWYKIAVEETATNDWAIQYVGATGSGVPTWKQAGEFNVTSGGTTNVTVNMADDVQLYGEQVVGIEWEWWIDTSDSNKILRLQPGEWRRPFAGDPTDSLFKHVLRGPYPSRAAAAAAS